MSQPKQPLGEFEMPNKYIYCDSCVFIAYFNAEAGRVDVLDQLFDDIQKDKDRKILTSAFSIAEVGYAENEIVTVGNRREVRLQQGAEDRLDQFWSDSSLIELIDVQAILTRNARNLMRQAAILKLGLKPPDALHLVSAQFAGVTEFFTYDDLSKYGGMTGLSISEPSVTQRRLF